jgi:hypothetical protein
VEPVEINAGAWYLRGVRSDACYAWEVCEVTLDPSRAREGHADAAEVATQALRRFAAAALGITVRD